MQDAKREQDTYDERVESRIIRLEVIAEHTAKTFDTIERRFDRVDDRFNRLDARVDDGFKALRAEISANFRMTMGIQITTLIAILGILAKSAKLF